MKIAVAAEVKMVDYHIHTYLCCHAEGKVNDYVDTAVNRGLKEIGFADHFPLSLMEVEPKAPVTMEADEIDLYLKMVSDVAARDDITVKTGIELDYIPLKTVELRSMLNNLPFDYIIGSIHFMDDWDFSHPFFAHEYKERSIADVYERYFSLVSDACSSGLFDIVGHVDVIKKFGYRPEAKILDGYYREVAGVLANNNVCLEVNTSGIDAPVNEMYPAVGLIKYCIDNKVNITLGSDAHAPQQVGRYFPETIEMLKSMGLKEIMTFSSRKGSLISI